MVNKPFRNTKEAKAALKLLEASVGRPITHIGGKQDIWVTEFPRILTEIRDELFGTTPPSESIQDYMTRRIGEVIKPAARRWLEKERVKTRVATQFIGEGGENTSTRLYAGIYEEKGLANTGNYTSDDIIFIASNGNRDKGIAPVSDQN